MNSHDALICIVDEQEVGRDSLASLIRASGCEVECLVSIDAFLDRPPSRRPGCLILEVSPELLDGSALQKVVANRREMPIVFTSVRRDIAMTVRAMKTGAVDFLLRPFADEAIFDAIKAALDRSRQVLAQEEAVSGLRAHYVSLSRREREVLRLAVSGRLNKQIGAELGISEITVKAHRGKVMRKMAAASFAELVTMAGKLRGNPDAVQSTIVSSGLPFSTI